ncbi:hypothetical protein [Phocaeicola vulgatus]|uniref:hypothetical protein n=1 Tax=Phocaeicola vulgatus TaxID=821 RepID=UPI0035693523
MKRFKLKAMALSLMLAIGMNAQAGETKVDNPRFPRKALVAPDCMINTMINVVDVASGANEMNNLLDENLDNYATLAGLADVGLLSNPVVSVKDLKHTYPAGTKAGFCIQSEAGSKLLSLEVLKNVSIILYKDGKIQETLPVEQVSGSVLSLGLIQVANNDANTNLTVTSTLQFDEIGLLMNGVNVEALNATKVKYAFVGNSDVTHLIEGKVDGIKSNHEPLFEENPLINTRLDDYLTIPAILLDLGAEIKLSWTKEFPKGTRVGFKFDDTNLLDIELAGKISIKLTDASGKSTETPINGKVLGVSLIGKSTYDISIQAEQKFNKAELLVKGLGIAVKARHFYYGYIEEEPEVTHHHDLNLSMNPVICPEETEYQLQPSDGSVTWTLQSQPTEDNSVQVSADGKVTNMAAGVMGEYVFKATAKDGCSGTVTLTKGIQQSVNPECNKPIADEMELADNIHGFNGSLISISDLKNSENIIDQDMSTYAEYIGGLSLANNVQIIGVKKKTTEPMWTGGADGKRVGFVVEMNSGVLGLNALEFYRIRLFNNKTQSYVHDAVVSRWNTVSAGLIGNNQVQKVRLSVEVPAGTEFDEITLWKSGVLDLQLNALRIYGAFMNDAGSDCYTDDPLGCGSTIISAQTTGVSINYDETGFTGLVGAAAFIKNLQNLIDDKRETYTYSDGIKVGATVKYAVKLGRTFGKNQQIGIIMDKETYLANLDVINSWTMKTYYRGTETGDEKKGWNVLGLDAIGYGDKIYLLLNPTKSFDEIRIQTGTLVEALSGLKLYGLFVRNDADGDGIPDCEDENSCGPEEPQQPDPEQPGDINFTLSAEHLCQQSDLTVTIKGTVGTVYKISCTEQGINNEEVTVQANGEGSWTGAMPNAVREATLTVTTQDGAKSTTKKFAVHPLQTRWQGTVDTDWNNWDNWTEGSPIGCSNVIIPAGCVNYPVLTVASENLCSHIHFEMGAEVVNTHFLTYERASVDMTLNEADRYYTLSAPLHGMVTGDMFIPADGNPDVFVEANATNAPQNRFNPRIYQRLWASNAKGQIISGSQIEVTPDETRWTPPFNALAEKYEPGKGFSMKAVGNAAEGDLTFRFPKTHTEYEYVTDQNQPTGIKENISRVNVGRFIYEKGDGAEAFPFTVTLSNKDAGTTFLAGNPFMAHIDVAKFMAVNNFTSVKVYDGNNANSQILVDGELVSNGADYTHIAPMQSVFVTVANDAQTLNVTYTTDMLASAPGSLLKSHRMAAESYSDLSLSATAGKHVANTLVRLSAAASKAYVPGEDAELLVDNEVRPAIALFSVAGGKSLDIQQLDGADRIPLGFYLQTPDTVSLTIRKSGSGEWDGWYLSDIQLQKNYPLETAETVIPLGVLSTNVGRFFLVKGNPTANESIADGDIRCYCYREGTDRIVVRSTNAPMIRCEIYSASGTLVDRTNGESTEYRLRPTSGVNIIKVYPEGKEPQVFKVSCY